MANLKGRAYRKTIRIGGEVQNSPRFYGKEGKQKARDWYAEKLKEKDFIERGLLSSSVPTFFVYSKAWLAKRSKTHPKATWYSDDQRLRKYLFPRLMEYPLDRITRNQMREVLLEAQQEHNLSIATRTRIKALASKIFNDAMNENPPLVTANPCAGLKFSDPRQGRKLPATLEDWDEAFSYLKIASEIGAMNFLIALFILMTAARKSETIPRKWKDVKWKRGVIMVDSHVEQVSLSILPGTKGGSDETREVTAPPMLLQALTEHRKRSAHAKESDFIFADENGDWIRPRKFHDYISPVVEAFGRPITMHKLRHSFGRLFTLTNGNLRVLQTLLGHKSGATTQIYSELSGQQAIDAGRSFGQELDATSLLESAKDRDE
jgi:integrase